MARTTQFIGHTNEVTEFLKTCIEGKVIGKVTGMFDEEVCDLHLYTDSDGVEWKEEIQIEIWSSGPMIFLQIRQTESHDIIIKGWTPNSNLPKNQEYDPIKGEFFI